MATKTFEELKQMAIQIRDEKTNKQNTATRIGTQMLEHLNKLEQEYYNKENIDEQNKQTDAKFSELEKGISSFDTSKLSSEDSDYIHSLIKDIYVVGAEDGKKVAITYFGVNSEVFGGTGKIGVQIVYREDSSNEEPTNYRATATAWLPNELYELEGEGNNMSANGVRVFVTTSNSFLMPSEGKLIFLGLNPSQILPKGLGKDVMSFITPIVEKSILNLNDAKGIIDNPTNITFNINDLFDNGIFTIRYSNSLSDNLPNDFPTKDVNTSVVDKFFVIKGQGKSSTFTTQLMICDKGRGIYYRWSLANKTWSGWVRQDLPNADDLSNVLYKEFNSFTIQQENSDYIHSLIKDIYVVGAEDGKKVAITYFGVNSSVFLGEGSIGVQIVYRVDNNNEKPTNYRTIATDWKPNTLYELEGDHNNMTIEGTRVFVRTSDTFLVPDEEKLIFLDSSLSEILPKGLGKDVMPFILGYNSQNRGYIIVDKNGLGDFTTLTQASNAAKDGDIIYVNPGIYDDECIVAGKTKTLYIIGLDRDKCIIKNNRGNYTYAPIHLSSGLLRNLSVISESTEGNAYAVHADFNPLHNSTLNIENCHLQSNSADAGGIGIGLRGGGHITIKSSRLVSTNRGRALYAHDYEGNEYNGKQVLSVIDCIIEAPDNDEAIIIQGQGSADRDFSVSQYYIEFIRNVITGTVEFTNWHSGNLGDVTEEDFQGVKNLRLMTTSYGNSQTVLNNFKQVE